MTWPSQFGGNVEQDREYLILLEQRPSHNEVHAVSLSRRSRKCLGEV